MESSRAALRSEYDLLKLELDATQISMQRLETQLQSERESREEEVERRAQAIHQLQQRLTTSEEQWRNSQREVSCRASEGSEIRGDCIFLLQVIGYPWRCGAVAWRAEGAAGAAR